MKLTLTTNEGEVIEQWDLDEYDLTKQLARSFLAGEISNQVELQKRKEQPKE
jgi:hypothetical protein